MSQFQPPSRSRRRVRPASGAAASPPDSESGPQPGREADSDSAPVPQKSLQPLPEPVRGAVITVSDRCAAGTREDRSGPLAVRLLAEHDVIVRAARIVPDGTEPVREAIEEAVTAGARVVLTTGGTGVTPRDLTPEGTAPLLQARLEGIEAQIRSVGRPVPGARGSHGARGRKRTGGQRPRVAGRGRGHRGRRRPACAPRPGAARRRRPLTPARPDRRQPSASQARTSSQVSRSWAARPRAPRSTCATASRPRTRRTGAFRSPAPPGATHSDSATVR